MYQRCDNNTVLVFGGGNIAFRRVKSLLNFNLKIKVISPVFNEKFDDIKENLKLEKIVSVYDEKHLQKCFFVLACTDNNDVNHAIAFKCKVQNIPVNSASCKEDSTFYFPYLVITNDITIGAVGDGNDHKKTKNLGDEIKTFLMERRD